MIIPTGGLPKNLSKRDFFSGISRPVNIVLARIFIQLGLIEQTGHGVLLVTEKYGENAFEFLDNFLRVTIPFNYSLENNGTQDGTQDGTQEKDIKEKIKELIKTNDKITRKAIANELGISIRTLQRVLNEIKEIQYIGSGYSGHWTLKE